MNRRPPSATRWSDIWRKFIPARFPRARRDLTARWVTLNKRTLPGTLPWWDDAVLVYHSTLRLIEGLLTPDEVRQALERGYLNAASQRALGHSPRRSAQAHFGARARHGAGLRPVRRSHRFAGGNDRDHVIPISQGGPDALANVQLAHRSCNELKGNALPEQYPPFFPQPGTEAAGWYGRPARRGRSDRGGRVRRGRPPVTTGAFQAQPADVAAPVAPTPGRPRSARQRPKEGLRGTLCPGRAGNGSRLEPSDRPSTGRSPAGLRWRSSAPLSVAGETNAEPDDDRPTAEPSGGGRRPRGTVVAGSGAGGHVGGAAGAGQTNRTGRPAPRRCAPSNSCRGHRRAPPKPKAWCWRKRHGRKGTFRLLDWEGRHVLVEERGRRQTVHLVHMIHALSPDAYVWYLSRFGRTSPLAVAMALLSLLQKGVRTRTGACACRRTGVGS